MSDMESAYIPWVNGQYAAPPVDDGKPHVWAQKGFKFHDLLDIVNPLQHLPVISAIYRWATGKSIGNLPRVVGDALYGGIPGFVSGLFGVLLKEETGKDVGEHVVATLFGNSTPKPTPQQAELTIEQAAALTHTPIETTALAPLPAVAATAPSDAPPPAPQPTAAPRTPSPVAATAPPPQPAAAAAPAQPDHPPIPLVRGVGMTVPAPAALAASTAQRGAEQAFLVQAAERKRQVFGANAPAETGRILNPQPVPLQLPSGVTGLKLMRPGALVSAASVSAAPAAPASAGPVDISQKMLDALDKYVAMQRQSTAGRSERGGQIDLSP